MAALAAPSSLFLSMDMSGSQLRPLWSPAERSQHSRGHHRDWGGPCVDQTLCLVDGAELGDRVLPEVTEV